MKITTDGLDLAKFLMQILGVDDKGRVAVRKQLRRGQVSVYFANWPPCLIGLGACGSAHYWARKLAGFGHTVKLMVPQFVKPSVKTNSGRCGGCRGALRGGGAARHAFCAGEER